MARVREAKEANTALILKRAIAYASKHGSIPRYAEEEPHVAAILKAAIADPAVVRTCAIKLGMVLRRVPVAVLRDGEIDVKVMELYEANPSKVVRIASLVSK